MASCLTILQLDGYLKARLVKKETVLKAENIENTENFKFNELWCVCLILGLTSVSPSVKL